MGNNETKKAGNQIFHAKVKKEDGSWEFLGTVVIRGDGKGGVFYRRTGQVDESGQEKSDAIALFPEAGEGLHGGGPLVAPEAPGRA